MARKHWFRFKIVVKDDERALLMRNGKLEKLLGPGKYSELDVKRELEVELFNVAQEEFPATRALMLQKTHHELVAEHFEIVQTGPTQIAIVSLDGDPMHLVLNNSTRVFWKTVTDVDVEMIDTAEDFRVSQKHFAKLDLKRTSCVITDVVESYEAALLLIDGKLVETLKPGRHAFWAVGRTICIRKVDLRPQPHEVTAQEILTKDRVAIRVTLTAFYKVVDPVLVTTATGDLAATIHRLIQFAIREAVATRTLDDILAARNTIDREVRDYVKDRVAALGAQIGDLGIKDVILPGDVRELLNKVVEAERIAKANLIRRQEETAATRSLLNTAKLMENNPLLLRLKELEALEKLVEKVGRIDLHTGNQAAGFEALLSKLYAISGQLEGPESSKE